ncbi:hypothetical protein RB195_019332 [Necator americanus]|uniref:Reverse transcriptase domain-containing protein n=1 Tax=Necator americanus TaxID=51031 RepID=A0ABR1CDP2_NECAM
MEKIIYDFYSDFFDSHIYLPPHHLREGGHVIPLLPCRIEKVLDEGQPCEQAGFRKGFSTVDHIHTVLKLIEVSRDYKVPLCLTFIDLKKAFDSVETEAVVEALDNQGVPTQHIKPPSNAMRKLECHDMGVKADGRQLHHLRFVDDRLIIPSISHPQCSSTSARRNECISNAPATFIWLGN